MDWRCPAVVTALQLVSSSPRRAGASAIVSDARLRLHTTPSSTTSLGLFFGSTQESVTALSPPTSWRTISSFVSVQANLLSTCDIDASARRPHCRCEPSQNRQPPLHYGWIEALASLGTISLRTCVKRRERSRASPHRAELFLS